MTTSAAFSRDDVAALAAELGVADEVDLEQLRAGMEVELEHGRRDPLTNVTDDDPLLTAKIALAHLRELPDYYVRLAAMEAAGEGARPSSDISRPPSWRDRHAATEHGPMVDAGGGRLPAPYSDGSGLSTGGIAQPNHSSHC